MLVKSGPYGPYVEVAHPPPTPQEAEDAALVRRCTFTVTQYQNPC